MALADIPCPNETYFHALHRTPPPFLDFLSRNLQTLKNAKKENLYNLYKLLS
jgi:hypothetical protein